MREQLIEGEIIYLRHDPMPWRCLYCIDATMFKELGWVAVIENLFTEKSRVIDSGADFIKPIDVLLNDII